MVVKVLVAVGLVFTGLKGGLKPPKFELPSDESCESEGGKYSPLIGSSGSLDPSSSSSASTGWTQSSTFWQFCLVMPAF